MPRTGDAAPPVEAIAFDLYGTLLHVGERALQRAGRRLGGAHRASWVAALRELLVTPCASREELVSRLAAALPGAPRARLAEALERELASIRKEPGAVSLLHFWKRRGVKVGLLSNVASPYKELLAESGLAELIDAPLFSCDEGLAKPEPALYERLAARLGVAPERVLFVGDSAPNDVEGPRRAGMRTAGLSGAGGDVTLERLAEVGLLRLSGGPVAPLLSAGDALGIGPGRVTLRRALPVEDDDQGRYNLVYRVEGEDEAGRPLRLYLKRFLLPETAFTEELGHRLQAESGLPALRAAVLRREEEPLLLLSEAPGRKYAGEMTPEIAHHLGAHFVFAFLFSNADIRPRNAFLAEDGRTITMLDMEHCFFNLALDVEGLAEPLRPETFDLMPKAELAARTKKKVLTQRATSRARRSFFGETPRSSPVTDAFRDGFVAAYRTHRERREELLAELSRRLKEEPPIVVGTQSYRRALAQVDVGDVASRLDMEPEAAFEWCY